MGLSGEEIRKRLFNGDIKEVWLSGLSEGCAANGGTEEAGNADDGEGGDNYLDDDAGFHGLRFKSIPDS